MRARISVTAVPCMRARVPVSARAHISVTLRAYPHMLSQHRAPMPTHASPAPAAHTSLSPHTHVRAHTFLASRTHSRHHAPMHGTRIPVTSCAHTQKRYPHRVHKHARTHTDTHIWTHALNTALWASHFAEMGHRGPEMDRPPVAMLSGSPLPGEERTQCPQRP